MAEEPQKDDDANSQVAEQPASPPPNLNQPPPSPLGEILANAADFVFTPYVTVQRPLVDQPLPSPSGKSETKSKGEAEEPLIPPFSYSNVEQYQKHVLSLMHRYDERAMRGKVIHNVLQLTIFVGAAAATILISVSEISKVVPIILTAVVTAATAIANYYKFGEHSRYFELVAEDMALEYNQFNTKRGIYRGKDEGEALALFMDRTEALMLEQRQRSAALDQLKETRK